MDNYILSILLGIIAGVITFTIHGYAHSIVAYKLGDYTPKFQGKLTLNPSAHIDILGLLMIILCGFGWSKSVDTDPRAFKNYYKDDLKVSLAGPIANLLTAIVFALVFGIYYKFMFAYVPYAVSRVICILFSQIIMFNLSIAVFQLLPLPGLDGFNIFRDLAPSKFYKWAEPLYQYQMIILLGVVLIGGRILSIPIGFILSILSAIFGFPLIM